MRIFSVFVIIFMFFSCKTKLPQESRDCSQQGTVRDFDGLDGCGYLLELPNGDLLNPVSIPPGFQMKNGLPVRFSYQVRRDMAGICMSEKAAVELTCIEALADTTAKPTDCATITNPFAVPWMDKAIDRNNPVQIIKIQSGSSWTFLFRAIPDSWVYDCDGNLLCTVHSETDECHRNYLGNIRKAAVIWQGEGVWD